MKMSNLNCRSIFYCLGNSEKDYKEIFKFQVRLVEDFKTDFKKVKEEGEKWIEEGQMIFTDFDFGHRFQGTFCRYKIELVTV